MNSYFKDFIKNLLGITTLIVLLTACVPTTAPTLEIVVQLPMPTPTLEPTFTPSPSPTDTPTPSPTATAEPTSTPLPEASLSGHILDQDTGQPITGVRVRAGTSAATTDLDGHYSLIGLSPGQYVLSATHDSYDPALSAIFNVAAGQELEIDLTLYAPDTSPYPQDPMLTNPLDPNGASTAEDAERLARLQGLTGEVISIEETKLRGEFLVNYKIGDDIRAAVAELNHEAWELTDEMGHQWWIIKVCGNLASPLPARAPIPTPEPHPLLPLAEVLVDGLSVRVCTSEECAEVGTVERGVQVEVFGCLADAGWCEVSWSGGRGWCTGKSLRQLAVAEAVLVVEAVLPTPTPIPRVMASGEGKIIFSSVRDGEGQTHIINADGTGLAPFTEIHAGYGDWSPDGTRITFSHEGDIHVMNADGSGLIRLTDHLASDRNPTWSPDGHKILFISSRDEPDPENCWKRIPPSCNYEIYVMNADGSSLTNLSNNPGQDEDPAWSADGRIIFSRDGYIYTVNVDGSDVKMIAEGDSPILSPDGTRFVFFSEDPFSLSVMNVDGSGLFSLTTQSGSYQRSQRTWSPDGQKIAFGASLADSDNIQIYVINADGSNLTRLTNGPGLNAQPVWSPDSQKIAFVSTRDGNDELYVMNADGSGQTRLTDRPDFHDIFPRWSR